MSIFRSEKMTLWQMFLQTDAAYQSTAEIGELGIVEFRDVRKRNKYYTIDFGILFFKNHLDVEIISLIILGYS